MDRLHLHLISDSTGETLENIAKAAIAQFDDVEVVRHFWPMVRSESHLDRIIAEVQASPGMILFTLVNGELRASLERRAQAQGLPLVPALDAMGSWRLLLLPDHATPLARRTHTADPVPYLLVDSGHDGPGGTFTEAGVAESAPLAGHSLMGRLLASGGGVRR